MKVSHHINDCYSFIVTCFWSHNVVIMMIVWKFKFCSWCFQETLFLPWLPTIVTLSAVSSCWWWYTKEVQARLHAQTFINEICRWWYTSTSTLFWAEAWRGVGMKEKPPKNNKPRRKEEGQRERRKDLFLVLPGKRSTVCPWTSILCDAPGGFPKCFYHNVWAPTQSPRWVFLRVILAAAVRACVIRCVSCMLPGG